MFRTIVYAAIAATFVAVGAAAPAQAAVPVAPVNKAITPATGSLQKVAWRQRCWTTRRVRWRHGRRVVVRVRHCAPRHRGYRHHRRCTVHKTVRWHHGHRVVKRVRRCW